MIQPPGFDKKIFDCECISLKRRSNADSQTSCVSLAIHVSGGITENTDPGVGAVPLPSQIVQQVAGIYSSVRHPSTTALITPSDATLEKEAKEAVEKILGKELIMAG